MGIECSFADEILLELVREVATVTKNGPAGLILDERMVHQDHF